MAAPRQSPAPACSAAASASPTGVWDAGYSGRSQALMVVHNPHGFRVQKGARLVQLVFFPLDDPTGPGYQGRYQGENLWTNHVNNPFLLRPSKTSPRRPLNRHSGESRNPENPCQYLLGLTRRDTALPIP